MYSAELRITDRIYKVIYTDVNGEKDKKEGKLVSADENGFVVLEQRDGKYILIPKDRIGEMQQIDE